MEKCNTNYLRKICLLILSFTILVGLFACRKKEEPCYQFPTYAVSGDTVINIGDSLILTAPTLTDASLSYTWQCIYGSSCYPFKNVMKAFVSDTSYSGIYSVHTMGNEYGLHCINHTQYVQVVVNNVHAAPCLPDSNVCYYDNGSFIYPFDTVEKQISFEGWLYKGIGPNGEVGIIFGEKPTTKVYELTSDYTPYKDNCRIETDNPSRDSGRGLVYVWVHDGIITMSFCNVTMSGTTSTMSGKFSF